MDDRSAVDEIREALAFYADPDTWIVPTQSEMANEDDEPTSDAQADNGDRAREARARLAELPTTCGLCARPLNAPGESAASCLCGPCGDSDKADVDAQIAEAERRGYERGRTVEREDTLFDLEQVAQSFAMYHADHRPQDAIRTVRERVRKAMHVGAAARAKGGG
jgi:hypothetical protein